MARIWIADVSFPVLIQPFTQIYSTQKYENKQWAHILTMSFCLNHSLSLFSNPIASAEAAGMNQNRQPMAMDPKHHNIVYRK